MTLKCPKCQHPLVAVTNKKNQLFCNQCDQKFELSINSKIEKETGNKPPAIDFNSSNLIRQAAHRPQRIWVYSLLLMFAVVVVAVALVNVLSSGKPIETAKKETTNDNVVEKEVERPTSPANIDKNKRQEPNVEAASEKRIAKQSFSALDRAPSSKRTHPLNRIISTSTLDSVWFNTRNHLVEFQAITPNGPKLATGVIVDTRGWVVTSYDAVKNATKVLVRRARSNADQEATLIDEVRGVVAELPQQDLILLAVNRRLIASFSAIEMEFEDRIVASQYLIQTTPPSHSFPFRTVETRVQRRLEVADLSNLNSEVDTDQKKILYLAHSDCDAMLAPGSPLIGESGKLVAINSSQTEIGSGSRIAVPAKWIQVLLDSADGNLKPFVQRGGDFSVTQQELPTPTPKIPELAVESDNRNQSEQLHELGTKCEVFNWKPMDEVQLATLSQFIVSWSELSELVDEAAPDESKLLTKQLAIWKQKLTAALSDQSTNHQNQIDLNQYIAGFGNKKFFAGFAYVKFSAMELPKLAIEDRSDKTESVAFEIKGTQVALIANVKPNWPALRPDSRWFVIAKDAGGTVRLTGPSQGSAPFQMVDILLLSKTK